VVNEIIDHRPKVFRLKSIKYYQIPAK